jgi:hypothetical protein
VLENLLGIRLVLWLGPTVPLPAPYEALMSLTKLEVTQDAEGNDGFSMTFSLGKDATFDYGLVNSSGLQPFSRVVIGVAMGVMPEVLIDGVITQHEVNPSSQAGESSLTVKGRDVSLMLNLEEKNQPFPNQPDFLIFSRIIADYAQYGLVPVPTPTTDVPIVLQRTPWQHGTDLSFIKEMAQRNGFVFYVEPLTFGVNKAYFGPENRLGLPLPALTLDMGSSTNVQTLSFTNDGLAPVGSKGSFVEPFTKMSIPIPSLPSLRLPPLASSPAAARRTMRLRSSAKQNPAQAALSAVSTVSNAPEAVKGEGEVDTKRYGAVIRARRLIGVRGAGRSYDGFYYVRRVSHKLSFQRGQGASYTQSFTLSREGTGTLTPVVRP